MCEHDTELKTLIGAAGMRIDPDAARMQAVRDRMAGIARSAAVRRRRHITLGVVAVVLVTISAFGLAATEAGRSLVRWIFTPVETTHHVTWRSPDGDGGYTRGGNVLEPYSPEEAQTIKGQFAEIHAIKQAGGGRLAGLIEVPGHTTYSIEYTLADGEIHTVGEGRPTGEQAANIRIDEIMQLRDAGAGEIISEYPSPIGLGRYTIRFTLDDGQTVDLETYYPPGPHEEREAIFAETRRLKKDHRFSVLNASSGPGGKVWGLLRYTLSDGRVVGVTERLPSDALTPDGKHVAALETETSDQEKPSGGGYEMPDEVREQMQVGGGRLVLLADTPHFRGSGTLRVYKVEYTLSNGETTTINCGRLTEAQKAKMRLDEIIERYDSGVGEIIAEEPSERGLGRFTIRYTFDDGQHVDLQTYYPPSTRAEREAIFAEVRKLKKELKFSVREPKQTPFGSVYAILRYTLADGRTVGIPGPVPAAWISDDGTCVVTPGTGETVTISDADDHP